MTAGMADARRRHSSSNCADAAEWKTKPPLWKYTTTRSPLPPPGISGTKSRARRWSETAWSVDATPPTGAVGVGAAVQSKRESRKRLTVPPRPLVARVAHRERQCLSRSAPTVDGELALVSSYSSCCRSILVRPLRSIRGGRGTDDVADMMQMQQIE